MNFKELEFKYNLKKCYKTGDKKQLEKTYKLASSLDTNENFYKNQD